MTRDTFSEDAEAAMGAEVVGAVPEAGALGRLIDKVGYVFAIGIVLAALILLLEVFLRYVLNSPTIWAHETTVFLCGAAFVFGGLYCTARNTHIRVVLLYDHFSPARAGSPTSSFRLSAPLPAASSPLPPITWSNGL